MERKGKFIVIEGGPGSGKSTQTMLLYHKLNWPIFREPGSTEYGEQVRYILQERHDIRVDRVASLFGYMSCRANLTALIIEPMLAEGQNIILDRYWMSTYAYQGAEGIDKQLIINMANVATRGIMPDLLLFYDVDPEIGQRRKNHNKQQQDRYDVMDLDFQRKVRANYCELAGMYPAIWETIDANPYVDVVHEATMDVLRRRKIID